MSILKCPEISSDIMSSHILLTSKYHLLMGSEFVMASQFLWTSKSVLLLRNANEQQFRNDIYYAGYSSSLIAKDTAKISTKAPEIIVHTPSK